MDYYTDDMIGVMIDARVTRSLIDVYLPKIHSHLTNIGVDISTIVSQWYLCIFVTLFPNEVCSQSALFGMREKKHRTDAFCVDRS
jgi:hypothetical protein